jgi:hypothetical protein
VGQHEIGHVVEREGALEPVRRHSAGSKYIPGIIDEDVDARLFCRDPGSNLLGLVETRQVGDMGLVGQREAQIGTGVRLVDIGDRPPPWRKPLARRVLGRPEAEDRTHLSNGAEKTFVTLNGLGH